MADFKYLDYWTEYSAASKEEHFNFKMRREWCFANVFHKFYFKVKSPVNYSIKIYKKPIDRHANFTFLDKDEIEQFISFAKKVMSFKFDIEEHEDYYLVNLSGKFTNIQNRFILCWVRYVYEYPFNIYAYDALKYNKEHKGYNLFSVFNAIANSYPDSGMGEGIHAIGRFGGLCKYQRKYTISELKSLLDKSEKGRLEDVFLTVLVDGKKVKNTLPDTFAEVISEDQYNKRKKLYKKYFFK